MKICPSVSCPAYSHRLWVLVACVVAIMVLPAIVVTAHAQDSTATAQKKPKPTRSQVLKMKIEDLLELSLEEVTELLEIVGVSSLDELINLIVTTASKSEEKLQDAPGIITVITSQELEAFGALSVAEALDRVVSLYFIGTAVLPQNMLSVRGAAQENFNTQVLYLLDGRPFRESVAGGYVSPFLLAFPLSNISRIEIVRGPGSVLYGTAAYTGVVNIITKTDEVERLQASARYGSFNTLNGELTGGLKLGEARLTGGVFYNNTPGWDFTVRGEADVVRNRAGTADSVLRAPKTVSYFSRNIGANFKAALKGFTLTSYFGSVRQADMNATPTWAAVAPTNENPIERANLINRLIVDLGYQHEFSSSWSATLNATYNNLYYQFFRPAEIFKDIDISRTGSDILVEFTNYIKPVDKLNILVGALVNNQSGSALQQSLRQDNAGAFDTKTGKNPDPLVTIAPYSQLWFTGYFQADYRFLNDKVKAIVGGQLNKVTDVPLDFVPRLGVVANITDELRAKVLYGQAFRSASAFERDASVDAMRRLPTYVPNIRGTQGLSPERISTLEVQVSYTTPDVDISLTYFNSSQSNLIRRSTPSDSLLIIRNPVTGVILGSVPIYLNQGSIFSQGVEFEGKWVIGSGFTAFASASYNVFTDNSSATTNDGFGMPNLMIKAGLMYNSPALNAGIFNSFIGTGSSIVDFDATGRQGTRFANAEVAAYNNLTLNVTLDIGKAFKISALEGWGLNAYGNNLLNAQIMYPEYTRRIINSLPGRPGIGIYGGLRVSL